MSGDETSARQDAIDDLASLIHDQADPGGLSWNDSLFAAAIAVDRHREQVEAPLAAALALINNGLIPFPASTQSTWSLREELRRLLTAALGGES